MSEQNWGDTTHNTFLPKSLLPKGRLRQLPYQLQTDKICHAFTEALELNCSMLRNSCMQAIKRKNTLRN